VRTVIHEVVADIDDEASEIVLLTHWIGGVHTELRLPRRRRGQRTASPPNARAVRQLVLNRNDDLIAGILTGRLVTATAIAGHGSGSPRSGRIIRSRSLAGANGNEPWLNLTRRRVCSHCTEDAFRLAPKRRDRRGSSSAEWSVDLQPINTREPAAQRVVHRARRTQITPRSHPDQQNSSLQSHRQMGVMKQDVVIAYFAESTQMTLRPDDDMIEETRDG